MLLAITGHTARELAMASGLTASKMSERLTGKTEIRAREIAAWADYLGVDPGLFFVSPAELRERLLGPGTTGDQGNRMSKWTCDTAATNVYPLLKPSRTPVWAVGLPDRAEIPA